MPTPLYTGPTYNYRNSFVGTIDTVDDGHLTRVKRGQPLPKVGGPAKVDVYYCPTLDTIGVRYSNNSSDWMALGRKDVLTRPNHRDVDACRAMVDAAKFVTKQHAHLIRKG